MIISRDRLLFFVIEKFIYVWYNFSFFTTYYICIWSYVLLCFYIFSSTHFWSFSKQRIIFPFYIHTSAILVVILNRVISFLWSTPNLFMNSVFIYCFCCRFCLSLMLFVLMILRFLTQNWTYWRLCAWFYHLFVLYLFVY